MEAGLTGFELRPVRRKALYKQDPLDLKTVPTGQQILRKAHQAGFSQNSWEFFV